MATQKGIIKLNGTIGDITFYKTADGFMAREKGGVDGKRIATDPSFQRTRENGAEFGRANKAGKLLRSAFRSVSITTSDSKMANRLTQLFVKVIQADSTSIRGDRNVIAGNVALLQGFEFNVNSQLDTSFLAPYTASINRASGVITISIDPYVSATMVVAPEGATHYKLLSASAAVNFELGSFDVAISNSDALALQTVPTTLTTLTTNMPVASTHPLFLAFGINFYQAVNGMMYPLKNGAFNSLAIVKVNEG